MYNIKVQFMFEEENIDVNETLGTLFTMMHDIFCSSSRTTYGMWWL